MKKFVWSFFFVLLFLVSQFGLASALTVNLNPSSMTLPVVGGTFSIQVNIESVTDLGGFQFDINYNPAIVQIANNSNVVLGAFLGSTGRTPSAVGPVIDNTAGKVTFGGFSFGANAGPVGNGLLATITFTVKSQASGTLTLNNVQVSNTAAAPLTVDTVGNATLAAAAPVQPVAAASVPTMSEWGMIIFMIIAGLTSLYYLKSRRIS